MMTLNLDTGKTLWDTRLSQIANGDATVSKDLVFTTTFDGYLLALARNDGQAVCRKKLPAFTNAPIPIEGDTLVTAASYPGGKGQIPEVVAFRLGAHGSLAAPQGATVHTGGRGSANGASVLAANCSSCHTLAGGPSSGRRHRACVRPSTGSKAPRVGRREQEQALSLVERLAALMERARREDSRRHRYQAG